MVPRLFYPDGNALMLSQMKTNDSDNLIISRPRGPALFDLVSDFAPAGDQPTAISELVEGEMAITQWGTFNSVWIRSDQGSWNVMFDAGMPGQGEITEEARALLYDSNDC